MDIDQYLYIFCSNSKPDVAMAIFLFFFFKIGIYVNIFVSDCQCYIVCRIILFHVSVCY